jgi:hypothetical protein
MFKKYMCTYMQVCILQSPIIEFNKKVLKFNAISISISYWGEPRFESRPRGRQTVPEALRVILNLLNVCDSTELYSSAYYHLQISL